MAMTTTATIPMITSPIVMLRVENRLEPPWPAEARERRPSRARSERSLRSAALRSRRVTFLAGLPFR
jgi:hypothetical protein